MIGRYAHTLRKNSSSGVSSLLGGGDPANLAAGLVNGGEQVPSSAYLIH